MTSGRIWRRRALDTAPLGDKNSVLSDHVRGVVAATKGVITSTRNARRTNMNPKFPLLVALLCALAGRAAAQVNLLPQGSFEEPGANSGWAEGFNIPNNQEFRVVSENGKRWLRIENRDASRQLDYVHAYVKVTAQIASLTVSARLRAKDLKIGREGWHTARIALMFEGGSFGYPPTVP